MVPYYAQERLSDEQKTLLTIALSGAFLNSARIGREGHIDRVLKGPYRGLLSDDTLCKANDSATDARHIETAKRIEKAIKSRARARLSVPPNTMP